MRMTATFVVAAALTSLAASPALSCLPSPEQRWAAIQAAFPKADLSDADRAKVNELRVKAFAALAEARSATRRNFISLKYQEAERATRAAIALVGLVRVAEGRATRGCGGTYRLPGKT
jgi:hypothetical protein